eukprot:9902175-Prorocentrum_lima.AAC.1
MPKRLRKVATQREPVQEAATIPSKRWYVTLRNMSKAMLQEATLTWCRLSTRCFRRLPVGPASTQKLQQ